MNKFRQHLPGFVEEDPYEFEFETQDELLNHPGIKKWTENPKFTCFAVSDSDLVAVFDNNKEWWVVGHIANPSNLNFPNWDEIPRLK